MEKKERFWEKIKKLRRDQWILVLLAGILLVVISLPTGQGEEKNVSLQTAETSKSEKEETVYEVERRLEAILSQMEGAGQVQVMITQKDGGEKVVEKDRPSTVNSTQEEGAEGSMRSSSQKEEDEATVYARNSGGSETPYVIRELAPQAEGVLVLAEGADNAQVKKEITDAVMALFGLEAHKIKVMKMNERRG